MSKFLDRVWTFIVFVAVVATGYVIVTFTPGVHDREGPFIRAGELASTVDARQFQATVTGLHGAAALKDKGFKHDTQGVWIIVRVRIVSRAEPISLRHVFLTDADGKTYAATDRVNQPMLDGRRFQAGIPVEGEVAFEVPKTLVKGLSVSLSSIVHTSTSMDDVVEVPLPIATADAWLADETPVALMVPEVGA